MAVFLLKSIKTDIWCVDTCRMCLFTVGPEEEASAFWCVYGGVVVLG